MEKKFELRRIFFDKFWTCVSKPPSAGPTKIVSKELKDRRTDLGAWPVVHVPEVAPSVSPVGVSVRSVPGLTISLCTGLGSSEASQADLETAVDDRCMIYDRYILYLYVIKYRIFMYV